MIGLIIGITVLVLGAAASGWLFFLGGSEADRAARRRVRAARRLVRESEKTHARTIKEAQETLDTAQKAHANAVKRAERALSALQNPTGRRIEAFAGITLFERSIWTPQGSGSIVGTHAQVDAAGNLAIKSRATLTRMAAGGVLLGPLGAVLSLGLKKHKKVDARELYILVETPDFAGVARCDPNQGLQARNFVALINATAAQAATSEPLRRTAIAKATADLAATKADTQAVESARSNLACVSADPTGLATIEAAKRELEAATAARSRGSSSRNRSGRTTGTVRHRLTDAAVLANQKPHRKGK